MAARSSSSFCPSPACQRRHGCGVVSVGSVAECHITAPLTEGLAAAITISLDGAFQGGEARWLILIDRGYRSLYQPRNTVAIESSPRPNSDASSRQRLGHFRVSDCVSRKDTRQKQKLEPRSDSLRTVGHYPANRHSRLHYSTSLAVSLLDTVLCGRGAWRRLRAGVGGLGQVAPGVAGFRSAAPGYATLPRSDLMTEVTCGMPMPVSPRARLAPPNLSDPSLTGGVSPQFRFLAAISPS